MHTSKFTFLILSFFISGLLNNLSAQEITSIKGLVVNSDQQPLMGNAILMRAADSSVVKGTSFFDGFFELKELDRQELILKLSSLEFQETFITINPDQNTEIDLGTIQVSQAGDELDEVLIVANIPLFETKADGAMQVNVANTILSTSTSVTEILSKSPNVLVDDGSISLFGKGEAIIYLNGQRIMMEELNNIQASEIKNIEIISNPSAKYDAEGLAVINIVTNGSDLEGFKGVFNQNFTVSDFAEPGYNTNLGFDYRKNRFSVNANYGVSYGEHRYILNTTRRRDDENDFFESNITTNWEWEQNYFANYGLGLQYELSDNSFISLSYNGRTEDLGGTEASENNIIFEGENEFYQSKVFKDDLTRQDGFTLNYFQTTDTLGSALYIGAQYSKYNLKVNDFIDEQSTTSDGINDRNLKNIAGIEIPIFSSKIDYSKVLSANSQLDFGVKFGKIKNESDSQFLISENGEDYFTDDDFSRDYAYNEEIYAAYINYNRKVSEKFSYIAGLRSEYTSYSLSTDELEEPLEKDYFNIFPNLSATYISNDKLSLFGSFSSRISRPSYQSLNPTITYQDAFTSIQGNPNIIPIKSYAGELGATWNKITLKAGYVYEKDDIAGGAIQGESPRSYILQRLNIESGEEYYLSSLIPFSTNWWTSFNTINISYSRLNTPEDLYGFMPTKPQAYFYTNNKFNLFSGLKLQMLAWYRTDRQDGIYFRRNQADVTLGLEKDFFDKKLKLQVTANDIFHTNKPDGYYALGETFILFDRINNTQNIRFSLTYNFGKLKSTNYKNVSSGDEELNRL